MLLCKGSTCRAADLDRSVLKQPYNAIGKMLGKMADKFQFTVATHMNGNFDGKRKPFKFKLCVICIIFND